MPRLLGAEKAVSESYLKYGERAAEALQQRSREYYKPTLESIREQSYVTPAKTDALHIYPQDCCWQAHVP